MCATTSPHRLALDQLPDFLAVCRLVAASVAEWAVGGPFVSVTHPADELSVACREYAVPPGVRCEPGWRCLRPAGPIPFTTVGVPASLLVPLADAGVGVLDVSTLGTDYLLVRDRDIDGAVEHTVATAPQNRWPPSAGGRDGSVPQMGIRASAGCRAWLL
ncbi:ACT domain-containing protein [Gemmata sp.]|uniref:ACT domain-containing protein n=1 Tax=Gemmata sp. TaxID=1914242 RepID=UPI003F6F4D37